MSRTLDTVLFTTLVREEWRLHARLFGGRRFLVFPLLVAALVGAGTIGLSTTGTEPGQIVAGLSLLVLAFGLYSGTAGFAGSDMLEDVIGDLSLVLSSSTALPLSRRRLLGIFLVKDACYYGVLFVLPMAVGVAPLFGVSVETVFEIVALWVSLWSLFVAGMVVTVAAIALRTRGVPGWTIGAVVGGGAVGLYAIDAPRILWEAWTTGGESVASSAGSSAIVGVGLLAASSGAGIAALGLYDPSYTPSSRTATDRFGSLERAVSALPGGDANGLVTKTLLDLGRSSGGFVKPFVSAVVLLVLVAFLVGVVGEITGIEPAPGIFFGGVLGLSAFTTYNWLTQFDSIESYLAYPVTVDAVFRAKRTAFVLVGAPTVTIPYVSAVIWFEATARDAVVGFCLLVGYSIYYYGLTVYLAGFDPNEFLFDAVRFAAFTLGVAVVLVPTLVAGFVVVPPSWPIVLALGVSGAVFGVAGVVLSSRAGPRWQRTYLDG